MFASFFLPVAWYSVYASRMYMYVYCQRWGGNGGRGVAPGVHIRVLACCPVIIKIKIKRDKDAAPGWPSM